MNEVEEFYKILEEGAVYPVFQPIVSLEDGSILGYEALSRISIPDCEIGVERLFELSEQEKCVWRLEELCRKKSIQEAQGKIEERKLFLNVDPDVMYDEKFHKGVTSEYLNRYGILPSQIVFEITERTSIKSEEIFCTMIEHYKEQSYQIAIDDFGVAYAGAGRVITLHPHYVKIDMSMVRGIDTTPMKRDMVGHYVEFCKSANIWVIAEGIETYDELETLIKLGITFGQGYYLQRPAKEMKELSHIVKSEIKRINQNYEQDKHKVLVWDKVSAICRKYTTADMGQKAAELYQYFKNHVEENQITVVDDERKAVGIITREYLSEKLGGQYGYNLNIRRTARELMDEEFLQVDSDFSIVLVSQLAMGRDRVHLYNEVIVSEQGQYIGTVSVKDLLEASIAIQVGIAERKNPLTGLPGNKSIEDRVKQCLENSKYYSIAYLDLDNFKAYNDAYGFNNGDRMIKALVQCMHEECGMTEFMGHIGGDDFVIIEESYELEEKCRCIQKKFAQRVKKLYSKSDWERGCINSKNRNGFSEVFSLASVSIAILTNENRTFESLDEFSKEAARNKKIAKKMQGKEIQVV